jgi:hypothetical protein
VVSVACPPDKAAVPIVVPKLLKETVPVGFPEPGDAAETNAVKDVPLVLALTAVAVFALLTVVFTALELDDCI